MSSKPGLKKLKVDYEINDYYREIFNLYDSKMNGQVSLDELEEMLLAAGNGRFKKDVKEILIEHLKNNTKSYIDLQEYNNICCKYINEEYPFETVLRTFRFLDSKKGGTISTEKFRNLLNEKHKELSYKEINKLIDLADPYNSGIIDYVRLSKILCHKPYAY